jgi:hypothetical protein
MSRGLGKMQALIMDALRMSSVPVSAERLRKRLAWEIFDPDDDPEFELWNTPARQRSVRMSMGRALRQLEASGQIKRDEDGNWYPSKDWTGRDNAEREREWLAYHEAAHAVIGLQGQLPLTVVYLDSKEGGGGAMYHRHGPGELGASYLKVGSKYQLFDWSGVDAFGNKVKRVVLSDEQQHAHVRCSLAGGIAEAILRGEPDEWKKFASTTDMGNARHYRKKLGTSVKSWEKYTDETRALVRKHWAMIEAVANALKKKVYLHARQVEGICNRLARLQRVKNTSRATRSPETVVRRQHLKSAP